ncbi:MAG: rhodanese-like domain-containing protein [Anaerolineales bacterium]|nr:rhodanese-like domain-containing protein [Anaerolineales bacterium]
MSRKKNHKKRTTSVSFLSKPAVQIGLVAAVLLIIYLIVSGGSQNKSVVGREISVEEAYQLYQGGAFVLDVRTQEEWDEYHAPNTTLIPLDELESRLNELPKDQEIVVICRSGNRSKQGRDILIEAGFDAVSVAGGLKEWNASGYPVEGTPPQ